MAPVVPDCYFYCYLFLVILLSGGACYGAPIVVVVVVVGAPLPQTPPKRLLRFVM